MRAKILELLEEKGLLAADIVVSAKLIQPEFIKELRECPEIELKKLRDGGYTIQDLLDISSNYENLLLFIFTYINHYKQ